MLNLTMDRARQIYRAAIDSTAVDAEGEAWWAAVFQEIEQVLAARTLKQAA